MQNKMLYELEDSVENTTDHISKLSKKSQKTQRTIKGDRLCIVLILILIIIGLGVVILNLFLRLL